VKNTVLTIVLLALATALYLEITTVKIRKVIAVSVLKNKSNIKSVHQFRRIISDKKFNIDRIDFLTSGNQLIHSELGNLGYDENYFVDFKASFTVKRSTSYQFQIGSDDGFALYIDDQLICEFARQRTYAKSNCGTNLTVGQHQLKLNYFQGIGDVGLSAKYKHVRGRGLTFIGSDTDYVTFFPYQAEHDQ